MKLSNPADILPGLPRGARAAILRLRSLGDMVMLTPALAALHSWRPDLRLTVVAEPAFAPVLEGNPAVADVLLHRSFFETARALRRQQFAVLFNQHAGPTSALLTAATSVPLRVCWSGRQFSFLYNVLAPEPSVFFGERPVHTVEHRITQFYAAGLPQGEIPCARVYPQSDATLSVAAKLAARGIPQGQSYAVIHPGASDPRKRWSTESFGAVAQWLAREHNLRPIVRLGPSDTAIASSVRQSFGSDAVVFDASAMDLRETIALIGGAQLFLGNDSGPAHIATGAGRRVVVIFGATDAHTWRPWQVEHRVVEATGPCPRCAAGRCYASAGTRCILSVSIEQVQQACHDLLVQNHARRK
ncbi:MAG: glycosyltransferase family 9 protein [Candidatus Acidiferrales bacterium]